MVVFLMLKYWMTGTYVVYPNDRNVNNSGKSSGGGVLIAVKKFLTSKCLSDSNSFLEDVWISLQCCHNPFVFGAIYLPPDATTVSYAKHVQVVKNLLYNIRRSTFFILGDYNLPNMKWINDSDTKLGTGCKDTLVICNSAFMTLVI
jgi:hypothetical protein